MAAALLLYASSAYAQFPADCKTAENINWANQYGTRLRVESYNSTKRPIVVGCPITCRVESWLDGTASGVAIANDAFNAWVYRILSVPRGGTWWTYSHHWQIIDNIWPLSDTWVYNGLVKTPASVIDYRTSSAEDCVDGYWDGMYCIPYNSPIIVDTDRNGYSLTSAADGVRFDLDSDGVPEQVAWTAEDSDDAFLAMDRNGDGRIDNGSELFGNFTPSVSGRNAANGFEALKALENPLYGASNVDGLVDAQDAPFARLLLWRDANHNGISEPDELTPASDAGLLSIDTTYKTSRKKDRHGNEFRQRASAAWTYGDFFVYDVCFTTEPQ
jgi:hypothetical protein